MKWARRSVAAVHLVPPVLAPAAPEPPPSAAPKVEALLARWLEMSELEQRAFAAMIGELAITSSLVETSVVDLGRQFQNLADIASSQLAQVQAVTEVARFIDMGDHAISLGDATAFIEKILVKVIDTILSVSKNAMRLVYSLDDLILEVGGANACIGQLRDINRQIRFLAFNAAIESARAGEQAGPFQVIAREIADLSKQTDDTVRSVGARIAATSDCASRSQTVLQDIATIDMSEHIMAKQQLEGLLAGMVAQSADFGAILTRTTENAATLSSTIGALVMGLQFQDRTAQQLAHVIAALGTLGQAGQALADETHDALPGVFARGQVDAAALERIVENQTLGEVRKRFLHHLVGGAAADAPRDAPADTPADPAMRRAPTPVPIAASAPIGGGDIELF